MKYLRTVAVMLTGMTLASCFKDEPLNSECDIEEAYIHTDNPTEMFFQASDTLVNVIPSESTVSFNVRIGSDVSALAPRFRLTEGATISPENGSTQDFSKGPVTYVVTSQDRQWSRTYQVEVREDVRTVGDTLKFDFEHYELNKRYEPYGKYYEWYELRADGSKNDYWDTGNAGFNISYGTAKPDEYPTTPITDGYDGSCVKLTTQSTGSLGALVNMRIAAGNLFIGKFDVRQALTNTLHATQFGLPTDKKPIKFTGYYRYKHGENLQDKMGNTITDRKDYGTIYAVLYKNKDASGNSVMLNGEDVKTNANIVAIADLGQISDTEEWTPFEVDFKYLSDIDVDLLYNYGYNLAIVFSSSLNGDKFEGAIGSTLYVDKIRVVCAKTEEQ